MVHIFSNQKSKILWGLSMEDAGIFRGHLAYFMDIWSILSTIGLHIFWTFGLFYGHLVYFVVIWYIFPVLVGSPNVIPRKIRQPCLTT
jgi:hypothetical protein